MKRYISLLLIMAICFTLCACKPAPEKIEQPANFYYRNAEISFGANDGLISALPSETVGFDSTITILNEYLKGPKSSEFDTTFPASTKVQQFTIVGDRADVQLNDSLARLTGIDLTIACACLTITTIELTGVSTVTISTANEALDGASSITMSMDSLMLMDIYTPETTEP